jgi:hypothetical protein
MLRQYVDLFRGEGKHSLRPGSVCALRLESKLKNNRSKECSNTQANARRYEKINREHAGRTDVHGTSGEDAKARSDI